MKIAVLLACTCALITTRRVMGAAIKAPLDIISLDDISESDRKYLDYLDKHYPRPKRSESGDLLSTLKASIGQGIKSKLGMIAKGSASASGYFSGGSSGGHDYGHHYDGPETYDHKSFDFWSLKKSILNTLLQAVKAIKGGVIAIKGQLIKGGGYLTSATGKLIVSKGEAITNLGKHIATSAKLSPHPHQGHSSHDEYGHYHHHSSGPSAEYGSPSAPGPEYEVPDHYHSPHPEDKPGDTQAGILIIKKIPHSGRGQSSHLPVEHKVPDFKPIAHSGPSFGTIIGKFFSASTSLKADEPAPFGDTAPAHDTLQYAASPHDHDPRHYYDHHSEDQDHHSSHDHSPSSSHDDPPSSSHDHSSPSSHDHAPPSSHGHHHEEYLPHSPPSSHDHSPPSSHGHHHEEYLPQSGHTGPNAEPPSSHDYGNHFEEALSYLGEYASASKKAPQTSKPISRPLVQQPEKPLFQATPQTYDEIRPLPTAAGKPSYDATGTGNIKTYDEIRPLSAYTGNGYDSSFVNYGNSFADPSLTASENSYITKPDSQEKNPVEQETGKFGAFPPKTNGLKYLAAPPVEYDVFPAGSGLTFYKTDPRNPGGSKEFGRSKRVPAQRPSRTRDTHKRQPTLNVVRSIAYELGPNGPKRL